MTSISRFLESSLLASGSVSDGAARRGQRVLQFVADIGGKAFDRIDAVVKRGRHFAQRDRQVADFILAGGEIRNFLALLRAAAAHADGGRRSRRSGLAMVDDNSSDRTTLTSVATPKTRMIARRSAWTILSISPACVDSSNTPSTARKRWIGTATETISSPLFPWCVPRRRAHRSSAFIDFRIDRAIAPGSFFVNRQVARLQHLVEQPAEPVRPALLLVVNRRQVVAQHLAARIEMAAVEQQIGVGVEDAGAGARRRDQPASAPGPPSPDRSGTPGPHRSSARRDALAGLEFQELLRVDGDGVGIDRWPMPRRHRR